MTPHSLTLTLCSDRIAKVIDLNASGAFLEGLSPAAVGETLKCKLWLSSFETMKVKTVVRHTRAEEGFGVEFVGLPPVEAQRILRYCEAPPPALPS